MRTIVPAIRAAGAAVGVAGAPATEQLFGFTAVGADFAPVGISAGLAPVADSRAVVQLRGAPAGPTWCTPTACAPAWSPRPPAGCRASGQPLVLTLHNALQESAGPRQRLLRAVEGMTIRGADLVLAVSSDLADNARRLGARDVRVAPAWPRPGARDPLARRGARRSSGSTTAVRCWWPSAGCTRRRATTSCSTPWPGGSARGGCSRPPRRDRR